MDIAAEVGLVVGAIAVLWGLSGFYFIRPFQIGMVERWGKYIGPVLAGAHWRVRGVTKLVARLDTRALQYDFKVNARTQGDGSSATAHVFIEFRVDPSMPREAYYNLASPAERLRVYTEQILAAVLDTMTLEQAMRSSSVIGDAIREEIVGYAASNGYLVDKVIVTKVEPEQSVLSAMSQQAALQRETDIARAKAEADNDRKIAAALADADVARLTGKGRAAELTALIEAMIAAAREICGRDDLSGVEGRAAMELVLRAQANANMAAFAAGNTPTHLFVGGDGVAQTASAMMAGNQR